MGPKYQPCEKFKTLVVKQSGHVCSVKVETECEQNIFEKHLVLWAEMKLELLVV